MIATSWMALGLVAALGCDASSNNASTTGGKGGLPTSTNGGGTGGFVAGSGGSAASIGAVPSGGGGSGDAGAGASSATGGTGGGAAGSGGLGGDGAIGASGTAAGGGGSGAMDAGEGEAASTAAGAGDGAPDPSDGDGASQAAGAGGNVVDAGGDAGTSAAAEGGGGSGGSAPDDRKFVGNITTSNQVRSDFVTYWNQITPENEGKWGSVEGTRNQMNWTPLDRVYDCAKQNRIPFKEHTLVWGSQQPSWLAGLSAAQQRAEVEEWIRLFCERYPDVDMIDVVNEPPPHTTPVYLDALGGAGSSGYDWIVQAFQWARQYCPNAILILNDYNIIEYGQDNTRFINIVNAIKAAGAPIDAVGAQAHDAYKLSTATVQGFLDKLASDTGLPVYVSEYDIDIADDNQQMQVMQSQFPMFWNHNSVKGITLWGYIVGATWKPNTGLMTASGTQRPAMTWLMDFLGRPN